MSFKPQSAGLRKLIAAAWEASAGYSSASAQFRGAFRMGFIARGTGKSRAKNPYTHNAFGPAWADGWDARKAQEEKSA